MIELPRILSLLDLMKRFKLDSLLWLTNVDGGFAAYLKSGDADPTTLIGAESRLQLEAMLVGIESDYSHLGFVATGAALRRLRAFVKDDKATFGAVQTMLADLQSRLADELGATTLLSFPTGKGGFYACADLFGAQVTERFPSAQPDIEEAGNCYALGRNTACAFHCMRAMEVGLRALGKSLNDPSLDPELNPTWERILGRGDTELKKNVANRSPEWRANDAFFSDAVASLRAVKTAWRNPTVHVKTGLYDDERALDVLNATKGFMRHLATQLSE